MTRALVLTRDSSNANQVVILVKRFLPLPPPPEPDVFSGKVWRRTSDKKKNVVKAIDEKILHNYRLFMKAN